MRDFNLHLSLLAAVNSIIFLHWLNIICIFSIQSIQSLVVASTGNSTTTKSTPACFAFRSFKSKYSLSSNRMYLIPLHMFTKQNANLNYLHIQSLRLCLEKESRISLNLTLKPLKPSFKDICWNSHPTIRCLTSIKRLQEIKQIQCNLLSDIFTIQRMIS